MDLAGHERYFKTTAYGLTGHLPDFACLIVGANAGTHAPITLPMLTHHNCHDSSLFVASTRLQGVKDSVCTPKATLISFRADVPAGVVGMCKEHLGVALALKVPVFFVITKVCVCCPSATCLMLCTCYVFASTFMTSCMLCARHVCHATQAAF